MASFQAGAAVFLGVALAAPVLSDTVSDALQAATEAYAAGDLKAASANVAAASAGIAALQSEMLAAFLPEAPAGWTREPTADFAAGLAMLGGGSGTEMRYTDAGGGSFAITIMADNPMVSGMLGIFSSDMMMATMGKVIEVEGAKLIDQEGTIISVVGQKILVQASGLDSATMLPIISAVDFKGLAAFAE
ncbi:MAG: hypothetical protein V4753_14540 [Pseudomonadota bacterium]